MADIDDPLNLRGRLDREIANLEEAADKEPEDDEFVPKVDVEAVKGFLVHLQANKDNEPQSNANHVQRLRLTSQRCDVPLVEMTKVDLDNLTTDLQFQNNLSKSTINHYKATWRPFFNHLGRNWSENIEFYDLDDDKVDKDKVYTDQEIDEILKHCPSRETAAVAILADTGCRIGLLCSTAIGHVDLEDQVPVINVNGNAPLKGADGTIPLTTSRAYIVNYLQGDHPRPDRDDVALIHCKEGFFKEDESGALSPKRLRETVKKAMKKAGIPKERRRIHNFRHTAVTRWLRMGVPEKVILHRTKWVDATMLDKYGHLLDEDLNQMTAEVFGLIDPQDTDDAATPEQSIGKCPTCGTEVRATVRYCPGCGSPLRVDAAEDIPPGDRQPPDETAEDLADIDEVLDEMGPASVLARLVSENPELLDEISDDDDDDDDLAGAAVVVDD